MSETKHTLGPWTFYREDGCNHIKSADGELSLCDTSYYPWITANDADWQLMAASPNLLDACEAIFDAFQGFHTSDPEKIAAFNKLTAAISKARQQS